MGRSLLSPPDNYRKKLIDPVGYCPLSETFTEEQIKRRIAFYKELNGKRDTMVKKSKMVQKKFAIYGWEVTTTVRVYMRETVSKIAEQLFYSSYSLSVSNINRIKETGEIDKDHGYVEVSLKATQPEIEALIEYIKPGSSYYVYDGEKSKYRAGDTSTSEFIITKVGDPVQPRKFWRRSQSFISGIRELKV